MPASIASHVAILLTLGRGTDALRLLLAQGLWDAALEVLAAAEAEDGVTSTMQPLAHVVCKPPVTSTPAAGDATTLSPAVVVLHRLGQLADVGLLTVHALLQQSLEWGADDSCAGRAGGGQLSTAPVTRYGRSIPSKNVAAMATATASAIKWSRATTVRTSYFHVLLLHALQTGDVPRLVQLWPRTPPGYGLPAVTATMRYALQHPASSAVDGPAAVPLWAVVPALRALVSQHRDDLDEMAGVWRKGAGTGGGAVLREWGR